jgi:hypothetical protein
MRKLAHIGVPLDNFDQYCVLLHVHTDELHIRPRVSSQGVVELHAHHPIKYEIHKSE